MTAPASTASAAAVVAANDARNAEHAIIRARIHLLNSYPFFGVLALRLHLHALPGLADVAAGGIGTDGRRLLYDPKYILGLSQSDLLGAVCHEVLHCVMRHPLRIGTRDAMRWNVAADIAINPLILESNKPNATRQMTLPAGALTPAMFGLPDGGYAEDYYTRLPTRGSGKCACENGEATGGMSRSGNGTPDHGHGGCSGVRPLPSMNADETISDRPASAEEVAIAASNWRNAVVQAAQAARQANRLPAGIARLVDEMIEPTIDWQDRLRRFITAQLPSDYRWFPPNRRYVAQGVYLPSVARDGMGEIVIGCDTSGSVSGREIAYYLGELNGILEDVRPARVYVVWCDAEVHGVDEYTPEDFPISPRDFKPKGGGGTAFTPVFDWAQASGIDPACLIYFTDMYPCEWPREPEYPVFWAATTDVVGPWGETVRVEVTDGE